MGVESCDGIGFGVGVGDGDVGEVNAGEGVGVKSTENKGARQGGRYRGAASIDITGTSAGTCNGVGAGEGAEAAKSAMMADAAQLGKRASGSRISWIRSWIAAWSGSKAEHFRSAKVTRCHWHRREALPCSD